MAYSMDLRERVLAASDAGSPTKEVAERFSVSSSWVRRLKQRRRETGEIEPRRGKTGPRPKLKNHLSELKQIVEEHPDATLEEIRKRLSVSVSVPTVYRALLSLGITFKKSLARGGAGTP